MMTRTRYVVVASVLTLAVGLGTGLVAYFGGFQTSALSRQGGPDELQFVPSTAVLVAYAEVQQIMASGLRQKARSALPMREEGRREFQEQTGINIETDIDRVIAAAVPGPGQQGRPAMVVLARGRFDQVRIESLMREHGAHVEDYQGARLVVGDTPQGRATASLAFLEPGLVALGSGDLVRQAVDLKGGGASITTNDAIMRLVRDMEGANAWATGRFDVLTAQANIPARFAQQFPALTMFSAAATIDSGVRGTLRAEARDEAAATDLREVIRGFVALGRMQASARPEFQEALQSLQLGGTGTTVSLSFDLPGSMLDGLASLSRPRNRDSAPIQ